MSSSQPFITSSQSVSPRASRRRRKSRFTFRHLSQLAVFSPTCPLRVIAHVDLDAFYAQCEMVRLGLPEDQPLAVQQWQGLIAINYPARKHGLSRHATVSEAQKACPDIILQHVATWKEGEEKWAYHEDAAKNIATHKVSLDPYRLESRRILAVIKDTLPAAPLQRVEKASVDEVFVDLSAHVHSILLERYPELNGLPPYDDPTENLPAPPTTALDWNADALVDLDEGQAEEDDPDWDDIAMLIGSEIIRGVRAAVRERLKYTCSAGLACNKMLAKLGSGHKKPNQQTIVRNRAAQQFLCDISSVTKIRMLGGKLGDEVVSTFNTDAVSELLAVPLEQLKRRLGDDTGYWLHQTLRGEDHSEVNSRTQIKSMLSAKSFRPHINSFEQAVRWLRIFVADIHTRLVEEDVTENRRRPKTINLHHRQGQTTRSKQSPIPQGKALDEPLLYDLAKNLLAQVIVDGRVWPCSNLSLSVGCFEDGVTGNKGIGGFLLRGDEAKALQPHLQSAAEEGLPHDSHADRRPEKRRRVDDDDRRINQFFAKRDDGPVDFEDVPSAQREDAHASPDPRHRVRSDDGSDDDRAISPVPASSPTAAPQDEDAQDAPAADDEPQYDDTHDQQRSHDLTAAGTTRQKQPQTQATMDMYTCPRCGTTLLADQRDEHADFHFAQDLARGEEGGGVATAAQRDARAPPKHAHAAGPGERNKRGRGRGRPAGGGRGGGAGAGAGAGVEKGQRRLAFGS